MSIQGEVIWLTGASSGIGLALAGELVARGAKVLASARDAKALQVLAAQSDRIIPVPLDVSAPIDSALLLQHTPHLDRVIINAGTCEYFDVETPDWSMMARVMGVNFFGAVNTLAAALPLLRRAEHGHVIAVASLVTRAPLPRAEAYGASKAALQYWLDALRVDLAAEGIEVTEINPGFVRTPLTDKNHFSMPFLMNADDAARRMADAIVARPRRYDFPRRLAWSLKLSQWFPDLWDRHFSRQKPQPAANGAGSKL